MSALVSNCLIGKPKTKALNIAIEILKIDKKYLALEEIVKGLKHKNPKISQSCIEIIKQAIVKLVFLIYFITNNLNNNKI